MDQLAKYIKDHSSPLEPIDAGEEPKLGDLAGVKSVVFDIYGTLLISAAGDISLAGGENNPEIALEKALTAAGVETMPCSGQEMVSLYKDKILKYQDQRKQEGIEYPEIEVRLVWQELVEQAGGNPDLASLACVVYECAANPVWSMPNLESSLAFLRSKQMKLGIISNAQFYTPLIFDWLAKDGLDGLGFDPKLRVYSFELLEGKPSTHLYQVMADRLDEHHDIQPEEVLYVGNDCLKDIWPAQQVGFKTALFAGDKRSLRWRKSDPRVSGVQPDLVITDLAQIEESFNAI